MVTLKGKSDPLRLMGKRLLMVVLAALVVVVFLAVWNIYRKNTEAERLRELTEAQLADLQARQERLTADYDKLKTTRGLEAALREQYGVGASGEGLIVIVEPPKSEEVHATSSMMQWLKDIFSQW